MEQVKRIDPATAATAHQKTESGEALLVCAYDDDQKCRDLHLKGSINLTELQSRLAYRPQKQRNYLLL